MTITELITAVKEKNLSKDQLESYRDSMSGVFADMQIELSEVEKEKAIFFEAEKTFNEQKSDVSIKRSWQATPKGLREIELKRYCTALKELLNSLKSRLYSIY